MNSYHRKYRKSIVHGAELMKIKNFGCQRQTLLCPKNDVASVPHLIPLIKEHLFNLGIYPFEVIYTSLGCFKIHNKNINLKLFGMMQWCFLIPRSVRPPVASVPMTSCFCTTSSKFSQFGDCNWTSKGLTAGSTWLFLEYKQKSLAKDTSHLCEGRTLRGTDATYNISFTPCKS